MDYQHEPVDSPNEDSSDRSLWVAVLAQALRDLENPTEQAASIAWFQSTRTDIGSLEFIAMVLDVDAEKVRQAAIQRVARMALDEAA